MLLWSSADFFQKLTFSKNAFRNTISVSNALDLNQGLSSVGPDLGPNCLQRLSADNKRKEFGYITCIGTVSGGTRNMVVLWHYKCVFVVMMLLMSV